MITKQQKIIFSIILIFLVVGLGIAFYLAQQIIKPTPEAAAQLTFNLQEINDQQNSADEKTVVVMASVMEAEIRTIGTVITYDPAAVEILEVLEETQATPFSSWRYYSSDDIPDQNRVELIAGKDDADDPYFTTSAPFGKIRLRLKTNQPTTLDFNNDETGGVDSSGTDVPTTTSSLTLSPSQQPTGATLKLVPATGQVNAGDTQSVDIVLDTNDNGIAGVEAVIEYNKNLLSITSKDQIIPAPDVPDNPHPEDFDRGSYVIKIGLSSSDPINKGRLSVDTIIPVDSSDGLNRQDILVARINYATAAGTSGTAHVEFLCVSPPLPTGEFSSSYACDPNPEIEDFSLVSLFDVTQPNYEGDGILTRVENGEYEISQPGITPTIAPTSTPTPTIIISPTPTITPTPTPSPIPTQTPTPTVTPEPGQASLHLALNACSADEDDLSRDVFIKIEDEPLRVIKMHSDGTTDQFNLPSLPFTSFVLKVMPKGHLPATFTITPDDITNNIIDLTHTPFIGGNSDYLTGPTGATSLALKGVTFTDENVDLDAQIVNVSDFNAFKFDWDTVIDQEHAESSRSDSNCSGKVNVLDYSSILIHWGKTSSN